MANPKRAYFSPKNWLLGAVSGINGKRYSQQPVQDYEINDDGTITAYGGTYNVSTDNQGRKYFDVLIPEYDKKTGGNYLNRGFDYIDSSGKVIGRGKTYNRYYVGNLIPVQKEVVISPVVKKPTLAQSTIQPSNTPTVKPKTSGPRKVTVPAQYREGLAKVENGETYYTFDGYSPEQIGQAIAAATSDKPKITNNYYISDTTTDNNTQVSPSTFTRANSIKSNAHLVVKGNNDEGAFLYKYPGRDVHVYKVLPEIAELVRKKLQGLPLPILESRFTRFSNVPLTNTPGGELNDSTFHDIFIPSDMDEETYSIYHSDYLPESVVDVQAPLTWTAVNQIRAGQHSNDEQPVVLLSASNNKLDNSNYIETGQGNLVFFKSPYNTGEVYAQTIIPSLKAKIKYFPSYKDNTGKQHTWRTVVNIGEMASGSRGKLSDYGIPVQSWEETSQQLKPQNTTAQAGTSFREGLRNIGSSLVSDFKSLFRHKSGGKLNYLNYFK